MGIGWDRGGMGNGRSWEIIKWPDRMDRGRGSGDGMRCHSDCMRSRADCMRGRVDCMRGEACRTCSAKRSKKKTPKWAERAILSSARFTYGILQQCMRTRAKMRRIPTPHCRAASSEKKTRADVNASFLSMSTW